MDIKVRKPSPHVYILPTVSFIYSVFIPLNIYGSHKE